LIEGADINEGAKKYAINIFSSLAEAEAEVHKMSIDDVAFHEVGAVDSIIDIVGSAICLSVLKPDRVTCGGIELGGGMVRCGHGVLPVPAPATLLLCRGMPVSTGGFDKEMTTPTGAAILKSIVDEFITGKENGFFIPKKVGIGIGNRRMDKPNFLRVSLVEELESNRQVSSPALWLEETVIEIKSNIDDMTGEDFGHLSKCLFDAGALDVSFIPCTMKKNRPGIIVAVLVKNDALDAVRKTLFAESSTIGFRETETRRLFLRREESVVEKNGKKTRVKKVFLGDKFLREKIEYDDK
jgi:uncharacterized protein (TIGR00299 family) protein